MSSGAVRVRFAPSPTGFLHVGGLRTALFNFLFARNSGGNFILRIEDTDRARYVEGAVQNLINTLKWAGLDYDEGPDAAGEYGPYVQSARLDIYRKHVDLLLEKGTAYRCFCTPDRLEAMRKEQEKNKLQPKYDRTCLRLSAKELADNISAGKPFVVRMKVPDNISVNFTDIIRGDIELLSERVDDQVLLKSDGFPTYHLANVVDDHLMKISHVIRGEEWLSSTPKHVLLYDAFGWDLPKFAHLPLLLNPDKSKLSKRQGDVAVEDYRDKGYLKEALVNFIALLGWNPGDEREIFSLAELEKEFSLEKVNKSGAVFNVEKLNWLNFQHLRRQTDGEVLSMLKAHLSKMSIDPSKFSDRYLLEVITAMRERVSFIKDFTEKSPYFFNAPKEYDPAVIKKRWKPQSAEYLRELSKAFSDLTDPQKVDYEEALHRSAESLKVGNGELIHPLRLAVSGMGEGPGLFDIVSIIGKEETMRRINSAIERIK
ncbi:MAG TPA: glutamate--tRNA ligase [Candidatus Kryptobacter bacterium]|nr:glutamate--tRNA ligase [Candidatus Kryptobacter bacterium]